VFDARHLLRKPDNWQNVAPIPLLCSQRLAKDISLPTYEIIPAVDAIREFLEIAGDFTDPLEVVREAISNSIDAGSKVTHIEFSTIKQSGRRIIQISIRDTGHGMDRDGLQSFFDLGNSSKRGRADQIGEKGHGTKVYFNCASLSVRTVTNGSALRAQMDEPFDRLHAGLLPEVVVEDIGGVDEANGTSITILGFNNNDGEVFTHDRLRDYVYWFTKFGSVEQQFGSSPLIDFKLYLKGLDRPAPEELCFGHYFPSNSNDIKALFEEHVVKAPDYYCKRVVKSGALRKHPDIHYDAVFSVEGNRVKQAYNKMLRRTGYNAPRGAYRVQDRYGIWVCKDFMPIERKNEWVTVKGSEYTRLHAFFNCQELSLTANRGSTANTPPGIIEDIRETVQQIYDEIVTGDEWREMSWLEDEADAYNTSEKERRDFEWRKSRANTRNICLLDGFTLIEPTQESGVYALVLQLCTLKPELFPFEIVDYETHTGIDMVAKNTGSTPVGESALYYVELKHILDTSMNHCFANIKNIVCWDTNLKDGQRITDLSGEEREMKILSPDEEAPYTGYFLSKDRKADIEVVVLRDYLKEKLNLQFRPRTKITLAT